MNKLKIFLIVLLDIVIQATLLSRISVFNVYTNISIPIVVLLSIGFGAYTGSLNGMVIGLIEDAIFSPVIGVRALIYFTSGFLIGNSEAGINKEDPRSGMILTFFVTLYYTLVHYFVLYITGNGFNKAYLKGPILIEMILNVLLYYVLFKLFKKIFKFPKFKFIWGTKWRNLTINFWRN